MNGKITISRRSMQQGEGGIHITIRDEDAGVEFVEVYLSLADFSEALTGLGLVKCALEVRGLDKVGKKVERKELIFEVPELAYSNRREQAFEIAKTKVENGWTPSEYFGSQNSFFRENGISYARTQAYRWVDKDNQC